MKYEIPPIVGYIPENSLKVELAELKYTLYLVVKKSIEEGKPITNCDAIPQIETWYSVYSDQVKKYEYELFLKRERDYLNTLRNIKDRLNISIGECKKFENMNDTLITQLQTQVEEVNKEMDRIQGIQELRKDSK